MAATDLATSTISDELRDNEGYYFEGESVASASALLSSVLVDGGALGRIEVVGSSATSITIASAQTLKVELQSAETETGDYTTFDTPYNVTGTTAVAEVTTIETVADVAGSLNDTVMYLNSPDTEYYIWLNINSAGTDPAIAGKTGIEVAGATGATADAIASAIQSAVDALDDFGATVDTNTVTVTNADTGATTDAEDVDTGFTITVTVQGVTGGTIVAAGSEMFKVNIPTDANAFIKAKITTAATNSGTIDIYHTYVAV